MNWLLQMFSLLAIHHWTALGSAEVYGTEGGSVSIICQYSDGYLYLPKYLCKHPCNNKDVLIKSKKSYNQAQAGRFVIFDNVHGRSFTVIINSVRLQDSGIYYCGIERWGKDPLTKVKVTVSKAHAPKTQNPSTPVTVTSQDTTEGPCSSSVCKSGHATTDHIMTTTIHSPISVQPNGTKGTADVPVLVGAALGVVMFLLLLSLAVFRKRSRSLLMALKPAGTTVPVDAGQEEEDPGHVYDVMVLYSVVSLPQEDPSAEYCMVQFSDPPQGVGEDSLYYRVAPH